MRGNREDMRAGVFTRERLCSLSCVVWENLKNKINTSARNKHRDHPRYPSPQHVPDLTLILLAERTDGLKGPPSFIAGLLAGTRVTLRFSAFFSGTPGLNSEARLTGGFCKRLHGEHSRPGTFLIINKCELRKVNKLNLQHKSCCPLTSHCFLTEPETPPRLVRNKNTQCCAVRGK